MKIAIKVKPMKVKPFFTAPISTEIETTESRVTEKNDGPACSIEQIRNFENNWDKQVPPRVLRQAKRRGNILHGAFSTNMQMPSRYHRETHDIDVWAEKPYKSAKEIEDEIDRCVGCDIAHIEESKIGKKTMLHQLGPPKQQPKEEAIKYKRYTIVTKPKDDVDVDYSYPPDDRPVKKVRVNGVWHETLEGAYERAVELRYRPMRAGRAIQDIKRIEDYWREKGKI